MQSTQPERKSDKEKLFALIRNEKVTLFIGSGFSLAAGAPSANAIVETIKTVCPEIQKTELKDVAEEYVQRNDDNKDKLINLVQGLFPVKAKCNDNQRALTLLPHIKQIFTTNYDSYIEDAYADKCHVIREEKDLADCNPNVTQIYKLHGDFVRKDDIIITQSDYDAFFDGKKNSLIWDPLKLAMLSTHVVFVGYSLDDSNIFGILRKIENLCNGSTKEMYLISPSTEAYKANRLGKHNVRWIQSTAEVFLQELEQNIKDNIFDDYRKKKVSPSTFIEFCHIHNINPDIRENEKSNEVVRMQGYGGKVLNRQISVRASYDPLQNFDFVKSGPIMEEGPLKGKYAITVPVSDLSSFECRVNGLKEFGIEDIQNLYLLPLPKVVPVKVKILSRNFMGAINCSILQMSPTSYSCTFDMDICKLVLTIVRYDNNMRLENIHVATNDTYKSQENALRWIEVIDAIFSGEQVLIPELNDMHLQINEKQDHPFQWYKKYYEYVQTIELKSSITFKQYNNFTPDRYNAAYKLYHWLTQQEIYHLTPKGGPEISFEFTNEVDSNDLLNSSPSHKWGMAVLRDISPITFNGQTFTIPYDYLYYDNCSIVHVEQLANGVIKMRVRNNAPAYQEFLTSTPKFQDYLNQDMITVTVHDMND